MTRAQANGPRVLWVLALALFAVSASHRSADRMAVRTAGRWNWSVNPRGDSARVRHPLPGLSIRARRSLPQARVDADRDRGDRVAGYTLVTTLPAGPVAAGVLMTLWVRDLFGLAVAAPADRPLRRRVAAQPRRLHGVAVDDRPIVRRRTRLKACSVPPARSWRRRSRQRTRGGSRMRSRGPTRARSPPRARCQPPTCASLHHPDRRADRRAPAAFRRQGARRVGARHRRQAHRSNPPHTSATRCSCARKWQTHRRSGSRRCARR